MFEQFSVPWRYSVNVLLQDEVVLSVNFSESPVESKIYSDTAVKLKSDLSRYFSGESISFTGYKVRADGFTARVLKEVRRIEYGRTVTYGELAKKLQTSPRAVGQALKRNPAPIIIPCHRVISKNGLGGYSCGKDVKKLLLELEGVRLF